MERPQNLTLTARIGTGIILLFHAVGLAGLSMPATRSLFLQIVPFHLLLMLAVMVLSHKYNSRNLAVCAAIIFITGFAAEWTGVHTGLLFGHYGYGATLGYKLSGIPLMIGVNWFLLIYATGVAMQYSRLRKTLARVITGATILVVLDLLIEPVAIKLDYWHWDHNVIPLKNYYCWFLVSAAMLYVFELFSFKKQSWVALALLVTEFVFFGVLNLVL